MEGLEWAEFRIEGAETAVHTVSVAVLQRALESLRQLALLMGSMAEGYELRQRFKPPEEYRQRYSLRVAVPREDSYAIPFAVVDESTQPMLPEVGARPNIAAQIVEAIDATTSGDEARLRTLIADSRYRHRVLQVIEDLGPQPGERWWASCHANGRTATLRDTTRRQARQWLERTTEDQTAMTVTGELVRVQFDETRLSIKHPVTGRLIDCSYLIEIEDQILASRRDLVQVTGEFTLGPDGHPEKLVNVSRIEPVDLSPVELREVQQSGMKLIAEPPLQFSPVLDESRQLYLVTDHELDIHVFAETRDQLIDELVDYLLFTWRHYAEADETGLTESAQALGRTYRDRFREAADAT